TAPARYSPSARDPAIASSAMRSTPVSRWSRSTTTECRSGTMPTAVVIAQATSAACGSWTAHRTPPVAMPTTERARNRRLRSRRAISRDPGSGPSQLPAEVHGEVDAHGRHPKLVAEDPVVVEANRSLERGDLLGGRRAHHERACELDSPARHRAHGKLDDTGRVREDELEPAVSGGTEVADLGVQRPAVVERPGPLTVGQKRLADVVELDLLPVAERLDRGVLAVALAVPAPEQKRDRLEVWVKRKLHLEERYHGRRRAQLIALPPCHRWRA